MQRSPPPNLARAISQTLLSTSTPTEPWTRSLEQALHTHLHRVPYSLSPSLISSIIDPFLLHHPLLSLGLFNWASQQPNFTHSSHSYASIFKSLTISRHFGGLFKLIKQAKSRNLRVDYGVYGDLIGYLIDSKRTHEAFLMVNDDVLLIECIGVELCNKLLGGLVSEGRFENARKVFDEMLVRKVGFNTVGFGLFVWKLCRECDLGSVFELIDKVSGSGVSRFDGSVVALLIIHGLCEVGRVSEAFSALEELRKRGCKPDFIAYRIVAEAFRSMGPGCMFEVQVVLKKKRKLGVAPRMSDYSEFLFSLLSGKLIYEAKVLGEVIVDGNFPIEDDVLNALIGSVSLVDPNSAVMYFKFMLGKERLPTLNTLSDLCKNLSKRGKIDEMKDVFNILSSKGYFTNLESYYVMVSSLCDTGSVREAYSLLQEMKKKGLFPDISFYNILMEALCREDLIRPAKKLWDEMFACGVDGNLKTYTILIKKFTEIDKVDEAQVLFDRMLNKGVMPDACVYTCLLDCLCQKSKFEDAIQMFYKIADQDIALAHAIVTPLVLSLCKAGCLLYASKFLWSNCHLRDREPHVILLKYMADAQQFELAIDHLKQVKAASPSFEQEISTEILALLSTSSNFEPILKLLNEMQQNQLAPMDDNWRAISAQLLT